ncbi:MAG: YihY/virulence factor BrkB family protein [Gemmatimonadetes bacterium]|nr:YihY/virulence factor BrkB family protein [Gemmatimonadota bacterium]
MRGYDVRRLAAATVREYFDDDMPTYAAALSYHVFFALFPFLLFLLALLSFLELGDLVDPLIERAGQVLPPVALSRVLEVLGEVRGQEKGGLLSFGIAFSVWLASAGLRSTMRALNQAYDVDEGRPIVRRYLVSIFYTGALALLITVATVIMVVGPALAELLAEWVGLAVGGGVLALWGWLRVAVAAILVMIAVSLIYYFAPNRGTRLRIITPGSVLAVALWALTALAFRVYVANFARYSVTYGSVGAVIVLLLYIYLSASVLLLGAELNAEIDGDRTRTGGTPRRPVRRTLGLARVIPGRRTCR